MNFIYSKVNILSFDYCSILKLYQKFEKNCKILWIHPLDTPTTTDSDLESISRGWLLNVQSFNPSTSSAFKWKVSYLARQLTEELTRNHSILFVVLTETWLKSHIEDAQVEIPGYNLFRSDRSSRVGRGVLLNSHKKLPITQVKTYDDQICQALICKCQSTKSIICTLYRPPDGPVFSFRSCLKFIDDYIADDRDDHELSLFGDFNLPLINWSTNTISSGGVVATTEAAASSWISWQKTCVANTYPHPPE